MGDIKVSIIIPVYNVDKYLRECMDSVISQSLKEIEIICVDDGSTDNSLNILEQYAMDDNRIRIISQDNKGLSAARNVGMKYIKGEFTCFLDSDDYIVEDALELLYMIAKQRELDILLFSAKCFSDCMSYDISDRKRTNEFCRKRFVNKVVIGEEMMRKQIRYKEFCVSTCLQFFSSEYIKGTNISFFEGIIHEDEIFTPLILRRARRTMCISNQLYMRRMRSASIMTSTKTHRNFDGCFIGMMILLETAMREQKISGELEEGIMCRVYELLGACKKIYSALDMKERSLILRNEPTIFRYLFDKMSFDSILLNDKIDELERILDISMGKRLKKSSKKYAI